jgi:hypothetical protein
MMSILSIKTVARLSVIGVTMLVAIQFIRPSLPNPPVTSDLQAPPEVKAILKNSCYNCHSNETTLSWFDLPVPAYWLVRGHVLSARRRVNFSEIGKLPAAQQKATLYEAVMQVSQGAMPIPAYTRFHPDAKISAHDLEVLKQYLHPDAGTLPRASTTEEIAAADAQYESWIQSAATTRGAAAASSALTSSAASSNNATVALAPNGIAFPADYKNWQPMSSTERFDNHTIRQILANDIAVRAIAENRIDPWPDGSTFAKIAWFEQVDDKGEIKPGAFFQVEFMIRDRKKYASTLGWGWARWRGTDLKPYGKDANFANECTGCHAPLAETDYVFTEPIRGQQ